MTKLNIVIPKPIEVVWGILRAKTKVGLLTKIILYSFYYPPNSKKNTLLVDHISVTISKLKLEHPSAATIIAGDKNSLDHNRLLAIDPHFLQTVTKPTLKDKILDIVITDLHRFLVEPTIIDPVPVDIPGKGVPSDHKGLLVLPLAPKNAVRCTTKEVRSVRPMPESDITHFGQSLRMIDWSSILTYDLSPSSLVDVFETITSDLVDIHFPLKTISITSFDKPWINEELKALRRRRSRLYSRQGRSQEYLRLRTEFSEKMKIEANKYKDKMNNEVKEGKLGSSYSAIRKLGAGANSSPTSSFEIASFIDGGYSDQQSADLLADHFSRISQEFDPIDIDLLPPNIKSELRKGRLEQAGPVLEELDVYKKVSKAKKTNRQ